MRAHANVFYKIGPKARNAFAARISHASIISVSVGNEIDGWLGASTARWTAFAAFVTDVLPHVRTKWPAPVLLGVTATTAALEDHASDLAAVNASSDVVMLTYYPLASDFTVRAPAVVADDFAPRRGNRAYSMPFTPLIKIFRRATCKTCFDPRPNI